MSDNDDGPDCRQCVHAPHAGVCNDDATRDGFPCACYTPTPQPDTRNQRIARALAMLDGLTRTQHQRDEDGDEWCGMYVSEDGSESFRCFCGLDQHNARVAELRRVLGGEG